MVQSDGKGRNHMKRKSNILAAFLIVMLALTTLTGCSESSSGNADKPKKDYSNIEMNPNIAIPGYESLDFTKQAKLLRFNTFKTFHSTNPSFQTENQRENKHTFWFLSKTLNSFPYLTSPNHEPLLYNSFSSSFVSSSF